MLTDRQKTILEALILRLSVKSITDVYGELNKDMIVVELFRAFPELKEIEGIINFCNKEDQSHEN